MSIPVRTCLARLCFLLPLLLSLSALAQGTSPQTIQFMPISDRPVTSAPFQVAAVPSSNLPVTFTVQGPATIDSRRLMTLTGVGTVTVTATQPGNSQFAATSAQLSFKSTAAPSSVAWQPPAITYGTPLDGSVLNASATAVPLTDYAADTVTTSEQIGTSQIAPGASYSYPASSPVFRYEGSTMEPSPYGNDQGGYIPIGSMAPLEMDYRVVFTCNCSQFEFASQSRGAYVRIWVDGSYQGLDATELQARYPLTSYVLVKFPDKRPRQVKILIQHGPPFYGVNTVGGDTISAPTVPVGQRVIFFGDSWTGPTIYQALYPPAQQGISGSGFSEFTGQLFNWDYWTTGSGGEGFTVGGPYNNQLPFPQRLLTDVCPNSPAAVVIMGGVNDGSSAEATVQSAARTAMQELNSCLPGVPIYFYGPQGPLASTEQAFAAAVAGFPNVHYVDMGGQNWIYGDPTQDAVGNSYLYFAGHPTPLGHNYLAEKIALDLTSAFPSLLPAPFQLTPPTTAAGSFAYTSPSGASVAAGAVLPAGNNSVTARFTPADGVNFSTSSASATIVVNKANSTIAVSTTQGDTPTLTFAVQPQIGGVPTGSLTLMNQGSTLATLQLANAAATYSTAALPSGTYNLTIGYSGDTNFISSTGQASVTVVQSANADFTVAATPTTLTTTAGAPANVNLQITPAGGLTAHLTLSCSGLPAGSSCAFAGGSSVAVAAAPVQATVVITTAATSARSDHPPVGRNPSGGEKLALGGLFGFGLLGFGLRRRRLMWPLTMALVAMVGSAVLVLSGCGGSATAGLGQPPPAATYTVQMLLTDASAPTIAHAATVSLTVNP